VTENVQGRQQATVTCLECWTEIQVSVEVSPSRAAGALRTSELHLVATAGDKDSSVRSH